MYTTSKNGTGQIGRRTSTMSASSYRWLPKGRGPAGGGSTVQTRRPSASRHTGSSAGYGTYTASLPAAAPAAPSDGLPIAGGTRNYRRSVPAGLTILYSDIFTGY